MSDVREMNSHFDGATQNIHHDMKRREWAWSIVKNVFAEVQEVRLQNLVSKLIVRYRGAQIKVEPNTVIRGVVFPCENHTLSTKAQAIFEMILYC